LASASIYAEALAKGAPQAQQVADRFHLTQNVGSALQDLLARHTRALREVAHQLTAERMPPAAVPAPVDQLAPLEPPGHIVGPIEVRQHQFAEAKRLRAEGWSYRRIAQELQLNRRTVLRYVQAEQLPRRVLPQSTSSVTPYLGYLRERWAAGCQQGTQLLAELQARGYRGSLSSIYRALKAFRTGDGRRLQNGGSDSRKMRKSQYRLFLKDRAKACTHPSSRGWSVTAIGTKHGCCGRAKLTRPYKLQDVRGAGEAQPPPRNALCGRSRLHTWP
jgi:hypothetical protein